MYLADYDCTYYDFISYCSDSNSVFLIIYLITMTILCLIAIFYINKLFTY